MRCATAIAPWKDDDPTIVPGLPLDNAQESAPSEKGEAVTCAHMGVVWLAK